MLGSRCALVSSGLPRHAGAWPLSIIGTERPAPKGGGGGFKMYQDLFSLHHRPTLDKLTCETVWETASKAMPKPRHCSLAVSIERGQLSSPPRRIQGCVPPGETFVSSLAKP